MGKRLLVAQASNTDLPYGHAWMFHGNRAKKRCGSTFRGVRLARLARQAAAHRVRGHHMQGCHMLARQLRTHYIS
ncbi:MAG: hypothetical protein AB1700_03875 [Bacillota bacterium]